MHACVSCLDCFRTNATSFVLRCPSLFTYKFSWEMLRQFSTRDWQNTVYCFPLTQHIALTLLMWAGFKYIHLMTTKKQVLRIDMTESCGRKFYATYNNFKVTNVHDHYRLKQLGTYSGTAGQWLVEVLKCQRSGPRVYCRLHQVRP